MPKEYIRFISGQPERIALAYPQGVRKDGLYGPQMFFTLTDGRGLYLEEPVAEKIASAGIQAGQAFWLLKHKATGSGKYRRNVWDLYLEDPTPATGETPIERDLRMSIHHVKTGRNRTQPAVTPIMPDASAGKAPTEPIEALHLKTQEPAVLPAAEPARKSPAWAQTLIGQTNELVDAFAQCLDHANRHGVVVRPEDVRTLLVTSFIALSGRGKGRNVA
jgi:hypothetical protein